MKKKFVIAGITCSFLLISGICYSCAYNNGDTSTAFVTSLAEGEKETGEQSMEGDSTSSLSLPEAGILEVASEDSSSSSKAIIYVHICGAVAKPGVYQAADGTRLFDFIEMSGGLTKEAAGDYINQAKKVTDGQRIYIPTKEEAEKLSVLEYAAGEYLSDSKSTTTDEVNTSNGTNLVNINTANREELMSLPGIGEAKADLIIDYRKAKGEFQIIEDLMNIPGIKEGLFSQISSYIIVK